MASTSAPRGGDVATKMRNAASTLADGNQTLRTEMLKSLIMMKKMAVDFESDRDFAKVKELEDAVVQLLETYEDCGYQSAAIESVANKYELRSDSELTGFRKLLQAEFKKIKSSSSTALQDHMLLRQFREAVWNVHHRGQPMPGEEQEDIVMTTTQSNLLNMNCPLTGKPIIELAEPVRSVECHHIYEKNAVMQHIKTTRGQATCCIAGCPRILQAAKLICDPLLLVEIDELRSSNRQTANVFEDFTDLNEDDD
ncbi:E3 SUMO-protein ligase MMS21 [Mercurialis annua]|uniref:E3 SUMO-protein ligase MMS21 n=1 Tax=Mercurialis annua TaxID=3986 RepID=UPI00215F550B|nr:E3 SUMO-protein ligase MMS21 [Mercurialis annua]